MGANVIAAGVFASILAGLILLILTRAVGSARDNYRARHVNVFWRKFRNSDLTIVFTEYSGEGRRGPLAIAEQAGGQLMTKGMAMALAVLKDFAGRRLLSERHNRLEICGDKPTKVSTPNCVCLGSPVSNRLADALCREISGRFDLPYQVGPEEMEVCFPSEPPKSPEIEEGHGHDYAVVIKACLQHPERHVLIVSGCFMYGTEAGAKAVVDRGFLRDLAQRLGNLANEENVAFLLKATVVDTEPIHWELLRADALRLRQ